MQDYPCPPYLHQLNLAAVRVGGAAPGGNLCEAFRQVLQLEAIIGSGIFALSLAYRMKDIEDLPTKKQLKC